MKKIIIALVATVMLAGPALCAAAPEEDTYKDMDELRVKLVRMKQEMDRFMKDIIATYPDQQGVGVNLFGQEVKVDVTENDKDVFVRADLPGMDKDKIEVTLANSKILKIAGAREVTKEETSAGVVRQERSSGRFERILELPAECLNSGIKANYTNGVLDIVIPKKKKQKEELVNIKVQ